MAEDVLPRPLLTKPEVCSVLRTSPRTIDRLIAAGLLRPVRFTPRSQHRFKVEDIEKLIEAR